jgi:ABC-type transport system substrate-binding protein
MGPNPDDSMFWHYLYDDPGRGFKFVSHYRNVDEKLLQTESLPGCSSVERAKLCKEIQALIHEDVPNAFLYVPLDNVAWNTRVKGINPGAWSTYYNIEEWYIDP